MANVKNDYSYVSAINAVLEGKNVAEDNDLKDKLVQLKASLEKRKSNGGKTKAEIEADVKAMEDVYNALAEEPATATVIARSIGADWTSQKVAPRLKELVKSGKAVAFKDNKEHTPLTYEEMVAYKGAKVFARA